MPVDSNLIQNSNFSAATHHSNAVTSCPGGQSGGGYGVTMESLNADAQSSLGHGRTSTVNYDGCPKPAQNGGSAGLGSASHALDLNHHSANSYGYDEQGAAVATELRGSYPAMTQNKSANSCGGGRKRRRRKSRKSKKSKKSKKSRRKYRRTKSRYNKPKRKRRKTKRRTKRRKVVRRKKRKSRQVRRRQKGGSSITYSGVNETLTGDNARLLGTGSYAMSESNCGDAYNHYTGGKTKTMY